MSKPFCYAPWNSLYLDTQGRVKPCCVSFEKLGRLSKGDTLLTSYSSPELTKIREQLLAGESPDSCRICMDKEKLGFMSRSQVYSPIELKPEEKLTREGNPEHVYMLDISFSNLCNLACKFCGPFCSSKWIEDAKRLPDTEMWAGHKEENWKLYHIKAEEMLEQVSRFPNAEIFDINGGEPFLSTEHLKFLKLLVDCGRAPRTQLIYTTNGTINNPAFLEVLKSFKDVKIAISSEGIGNTYRYSRGHDGAEAQMEATLKFFGSLPNSRMAINYTVSAINIFGIPEFLEWYGRMEPLYNLEITVDVVVAPSALKIENLPWSFRRKALQQLGNEDTPILNQLRNVLTGDTELRVSPEREQQKLEYFWKFIRDMDAAQKTSLTAMLPVYSLIEANP